VQVWQYILLGIVVAVFFWAGQKGHLLKLGNYVDETKVELKKCTWPSLDELKGSTVVVVVSTLLLGVFTIFVDRLAFEFVKILTKIRI